VKGRKEVKRRKGKEGSTRKEVKGRKDEVKEGSERKEEREGPKVIYFPTQTSSNDNNKTPLPSPKKTSCPECLLGWQ
jgi:hypothetical protein